MTERNTLAQRVIALQVLRARVEQALADAKDQLDEMLEDGDRASAWIVNGPRVGYVTKTQRHARAYVADERALADWVADHYPDEVVPQVRPAFLKRLLAATATAGMPMSPHGELDVPGVDIGTAGSSYLSVRPDPTAIDSLSPEQTQMWLAHVSVRAIVSDGKEDLDAEF